MEPVNGQSELSTGLEEIFMRWDGREDSLKQKVSADSSYESGSDTMDAEPIPSDAYCVINWVKYFICSNSLSV